MARPQPATRSLRRGRVLVIGRRISTRALAAALQRVGAHVRRVVPSEQKRATRQRDIAAVVGVARPNDDLVDDLAELAVSASAAPVFIALTRAAADAAIRGLYRAGVEGVFEWPKERRDLLYAVMRVRSVLAPMGRPSASNPEMARRVRKRLMSDPVEFGNELRVRALDRVVILRGSVDALWKLEAAEQATRAMPGVARVITTHLDVVPDEMPDRWVAEAVRRILRSAGKVDASTIAVAVAGGVVTLAGTAESRAEMDRLINLVEHARGVRAIRNLTTVSQDAKRTDSATARCVRTAIANQCPSADVDVSVFDGVAVIAGRARRPGDVTAVEAAALRQNGVRRAVNKVWANA